MNSSGEFMIFVDTGAFYASKVKNDINHASANKIERKILQGEFGRIITTNYIFDELITLLRGRIHYKELIKIGDAIKNSPNIQIICILEAIEDKAWDFYKKNQDKDYSFTDCTSFVVMNSLNIKMAFTYDMHFAQAGFQVVQ
ncbi:MAG: type II toxin-antitoxin system VapC family toxin [Candidatus Hodarchaeales archaeon]